MSRSFGTICARVGVVVFSVMWDAGNIIKADFIDEFRVCLNRGFEFSSECKVDCNDSDNRDDADIAIASRIDSARQRLLAVAGCLEKSARSLGHVLLLRSIRAPKSFKEERSGEILDKVLRVGTKFSGTTKYYGGREFSCTLDMQISQNNHRGRLYSHAANYFGCDIEPQASDFFKLEVCNKTGRSVSVAIMSIARMFTSTWIITGWWITPPQSCKSFGDFLRGDFYVTAQDRDDGDTAWHGNDFNACVKYPGPFRLTPRKPCREDESMGHFFKKHIDFQEFHRKNLLGR